MRNKLFAGICLAVLLSTIVGCGTITGGAAPVAAAASAPAAAASAPYDRWTDVKFTTAYSAMTLHCGEAMSKVNANDDAHSTFDTVSDTVAGLSSFTGGFLAAAKAAKAFVEFFSFLAGSTPVVKSSIDGHYSADAISNSSSKFGGWYQTHIHFLTLVDSDSATLVGLANLDAAFCQTVNPGGRGGMTPPDIPHP